MKYSQVTTSMAKDIAFKLGAELNDEEAGAFADGYNVALLKVNKDMSTALSNNVSLSTNSPVTPDGWRLVPTTATPSMVKAGAAAARAYMEDAGGNSPFVIYEAMVAAAPKPEVNSEYN